MSRRSPLLVAGLLVAGLAACSTGTQNTPTGVLNQIAARQAAATAASPAAPATSAAATSCTPGADVSYPALTSIPAPGAGPAAWPANSLERTVRERGVLVVGVAGDTRLLGYRDSLSDADPKGFDIAIATAIAQAIFGTATGHIEYKVITSAQRFPQVNEGVSAGGVDLVVRAVSMTCDRWSPAETDTSKGAAFTSPYLESDQRLLVRSTDTSLATMIAAKKALGSTVKICSPSGSTDLAKIQQIAGVTAVPVALSSDCLALWQEGRVDAITDDDVILAGFLSQDPTAKILTGTPLETTPYGMAVARSHPEFVQYLNAVMQTPAFHAAWDQANTTYLSVLPVRKTFPVPDDTRPLPAGG